MSLPDGIATNACGTYGSVEIKISPVTDCENGELGIHRLLYIAFHYEFVSVTSINNTFTISQGSLPTGTYDYIDIEEILPNNGTNSNYDEYIVTLKPKDTWQIFLGDQILVDVNAPGQAPKRIGNYSLGDDDINFVKVVDPYENILSDNPTLFNPNGSPSSAGNLYIPGDFVIDINSAFHGFISDHDIVYLDGGSSIIVHPNVSTEFRYIDFVVCDNETWDGFSLEDQSSLILEGNIINDSEKAISADASADISIFDNEFRNNYYDLYLSGGSSDVLTIGDFYSNTFENTSTLKQRPSGLPITANSPVNIFVNGYPNADLRSIEGKNNTFRDANVGIKSLGTNAMIEWNIFETSGTGIQVEGTSAASEIDNNVFTDKNTGIKANSHAIRSENNTFTNVDLGYRLIGTANREVEIQYNDFDVNEKAIYTVFNTGGTFFDNDVNILSDNTNAIGMDFFYTDDATLLENTFTVEGIHAGIFLNTSTGNILQENTVNLNNPHYGTRAIDLMEATGTIASCNLLQGTHPANQTFSDGTGMFLQDAGSSIIACNSTHAIEEGFKYVGNNNTNSLLGNTFGDHGTALELGDQDFSMNVIIGDQDHLGNIWDGQQSIGARNYSNDPSIISESEFDVDSGENPDFLPNIILPDVGWFSDIPENAPSFYCAGSVYECDGTPGANFIIDPPSNDYVDYIRLQLDPSSVSTNEKWIWKNQILESIKNHVAPSQYTTAINALLTALDNTIQDDFADVQVEISDALESNSQINTLSAQILDNLDLFASTNNQVYLDNNVSLMVQLNTAHQSGMSTMATHLANADAILSGIFIPSGDAVGQDYFDAYSILIKYIETDYSLNTSQESTLQTIAVKCPTEYGRAVSLARGMLRTMDGLVFDDLVNCPVAAPRRAKTYRTISDVDIFPNPVMDVLHFSKAVNYISITDVVGRVFYTNKSEMSSIPVANLNTGMYIISYKLDGILNSQKFIKN